MRTTVDIPDDLYRQVKSRSSLEGLAVREVTVALYQQWIAGHAQLTNAPAGHASAGNTAKVDSWMRRMRKLGEGIRREATDPRHGTAILAADRR